MKTNTEHRRRETDKLGEWIQQAALDDANKRIAELEAIVSKSGHNLPDEWRLKGAGQAKAGDWISFDLGGDRICVSAKEVLNPGTDREEVIYNRKKNFYFITSMILDGTSTHKNLFVIPAAAKEGE